MCIFSLEKQFCWTRFGILLFKWQDITNNVTEHTNVQNNKTVRTLCVLFAWDESGWFGRDEKLSSLLHRHSASTYQNPGRDEANMNGTFKIPLPYVQQWSCYLTIFYEKIILWIRVRVSTKYAHKKWQFLYPLPREYIKLYGENLESTLESAHTLWNRQVQDNSYRIEQIFCKFLARLLSYKSFSDWPVGASIYTLRSPDIQNMKIKWPISVDEGNGKYPTFNKVIRMLLSEWGWYSNCGKSNHKQSKCCSKSHGGTVGVGSECVFTIGMHLSKALFTLAVIN